MLRGNDLVACVQIICCRIWRVQLVLRYGSVYDGCFPLVERNLTVWDVLYSGARNAIPIYRPATAITPQRRSSEHKWHPTPTDPTDQLRRGEARRSGSNAAHKQLRRARAIPHVPKPPPMPSSTYTIFRLRNVFIPRLDVARTSPSPARVPPRRREWHRDRSCNQSARMYVRVHDGIPGVGNRRRPTTTPRRPLWRR